MLPMIQQIVLEMSHNFKVAIDGILSTCVSSESGNMHSPNAPS